MANFEGECCNLTSRYSCMDNIYCVKSLQMVEVSDAILIKQERLGENDYGILFKGERIGTQWE